jgi:Zn-dependent alcohol dehydrogenase
VVVVGCGGVGLSAVSDRLAAMSELDTVGIEVVTEFE